MSMIQSMIMCSGGNSDGVLKLNNRTLIALNQTVYSGSTKSISTHFVMRSNGTAYSYYNSTGGMSGLSDSGGFGEYGPNGEWIVGGIPSSYSVKVANTGVLLGSPVNTWIPMNSTYDWYITESAAGQGISGSHAVLNISIAKTNDTINILETATINLYATLDIATIFS